MKTKNNPEIKDIWYCEKHKLNFYGMMCYPVCPICIGIKKEYVPSYKEEPVKYNKKEPVFDSFLDYLNYKNTKENVK